MLAAALALVTSLCYGLSNFVGPSLSRGLPVYPVLIAGQVVAFVVSGAVLAATQAELPGGTVLLAATAAGLGNAFGLICFYRAASLGPLSIVTPIGSLAVILPVTAGLASGEPLGILKLAGIALAIGGVAFAARRPAATRGEDGRSGDERAAARWALLSAVAFGTFLACIAPASHDGVFWAVLLSRAALLVVFVAVATAIAAPLRVPLARLPLLAVPGVLLFAGTLAYSAATREGDLSVVSVLSSLFPIVTVGLAYAAGERVSGRQAGGVAAALCGIVLISVHA
jgi:drug/metabolite transporter (DMT)-like permease